MLTERLGIYVSTRQHLYFPAIATLIMALYPQRRLGLLIGFVAYIPWFLLHFVAITEMPGLLKAYYAYPYVVSLAWPLIWPWMGSQPPTVQTKRWGIKTFTVVLIASIVGGWISPAGSADLSPLTRHTNRQAFDSLGQTLATSSTVLKPLYVDESVATLFPQQFQPEELLSHPSKQPAVKTVLYCEPSLEPDLLNTLWRSQTFETQYQIRDTPLRMQTNLSEKELSPHWQGILESVK
jgi:hypothetical protein